MGAVWNDQRDALVSRLWMAGRPASDIAGTLGPEFNRNKVLGRVRRLGLKRDDKRKPTLAPKQLSPVPVCEATEGVTLADVRNNHCRWIEGEPNGAATVFCGATKLTGFPYCRDHSVRAFRPAEERKRKVAA